MRLPNLNFYVRLPGEYPVVRLKLKYRAMKKRHAGMIERNIRDALSPELEKIIQENERAAAAAGLTFPSGDEALEKGRESIFVTGAAASVASAGTTAATQIAVPRQDKPVEGKSPVSTGLVVPAVRPAVASVPTQSKVPDTEPAPEKHSTVKPPVTEEKKDNVVLIRPSAPVQKTDDVSERPHPSTQVVAHESATGSAPAVPEAIKALRNRHNLPEQPVASPLSMLHRARQRPAASESEQQTEDNGGGESMNLEMKVTELPDGGLSVTTTGKPVAPVKTEEAYRANRQLAQEEENILLHRDADDPGYDENDQHYYDREHDI